MFEQQNRFRFEKSQVLLSNIYLDGLTPKGSTFEFVLAAHHVHYTSQDKHCYLGVEWFVPG